MFPQNDVKTYDIKKFEIERVASISFFCTLLLDFSFCQSMQSDCAINESVVDIVIALHIIKRSVHFQLNK